MQNANSKFIVRIETCVDCGDEFIIRSEIKFLDRDTFRASSKLLTSPPSPSQRLLYSFLLEPTHRKKK